MVKVSELGLVRIFKIKVLWCCGSVVALGFLYGECLK